MENFYQQWLIQEQHLLNDLESVPEDRTNLHISLIRRALSHYAEYYKHKSELANRDVFRAFSAYWLTDSERSFFWLGGLNPWILFHALPLDLTHDQKNNVEQLRIQTMKRARALEGEMRHVQDAMAVLIALAAVHRKAKNGEARGDMTERVVEMTWAVLDGADNLRRNVVGRIMEVLSSAQTVRFLAALAHRHLGFYWQGFSSNNSQ